MLKLRSARGGAGVGGGGGGGGMLTAEALAQLANAASSPPVSTRRASRGPTFDTGAAPGSPDGALRGETLRPGVHSVPRLLERQRRRRNSTRRAAGEREGAGGRRRLLLDEGEAEGGRATASAGRLGRHRRRASDRCWSRSERHMYYRRPSGKSSPALTRRMKEYMAMHRACTAGISSEAEWMALFSLPPPSDGGTGAGAGGASGTNPGLGQVGNETWEREGNCRYTFWMLQPTGLGNRLLSLVSAFVFSVLTNRTLLVGDDTFRAVLCDPFLPSSSMWLPANMSALFQQTLLKEPRIDAVLGNIARGRRMGSRALAFLQSNYKEGDHLFFCPEGQLALRERFRWVGYLSGQYNVPAFFLLPEWRAELDRLFPDRMVFTHAVKYLVHPANELWERVTRIHKGYFHAPLRIGVQVRTFSSGADDFAANERVYKCLTSVSKVLPAPLPAEDWEAEMSGPHRTTSPLLATFLRNPVPSRVAVFVASLHQNHFDYLRGKYLTSPMPDGSIVTLHTESFDGGEAWTLEQAKSAVVDMWTLSLSDKLLTSEESTFGYVAAGLAGITPWLMHIKQRSWKSSQKAACSRGASHEPCFHFPPASLQCSGQDPTLVTSDLSHHPFLETCPDLEGRGILVRRRKGFQ
eukprot:jgi/Mesen1/8598/ME000005S08566